ncbi:MAG: biotin transporter BioY [Actinobacteria bacterium]|nr:biotin transporter BioY [Actinomycetota bacterium]MBM3712615.1 biotin transporter BioY [Actinomycetota bacterium]
MKTGINLNTDTFEDVLLVHRKKQVNQVLLKFTFSFIFAFLMWISANSFVYLPFTPVPMTMQVLTALIAPIFIGSTWAMFSQIIYISLGLAGLPVFSGFKSGITALAGPTGGYIIGFVAAGFVTGYVYSTLKNKNCSLNLVIFKNYYHKNNNKFLNSRNLSKINDLEINVCNENTDKNVGVTFIACFSGLAVIYIFGFLHLLGFLSALSGDIGLKELAVKTFKLGVQPFIIVDLLKITIIVNMQRVFSIKEVNSLSE